MSSDFIIRSVVRICFQSVSEYPTEARKEQSLPRPFINIDDGALPNRRSLAQDASEYQGCCLYVFKTHRQL